MKKIILAGLLATMMGSAPVMASATTTTAAQTATANVQKEAADIMQVAVKGANAMRDIQLARLALFHGQPDSAKKLTNDAASLLAGDSSDWAKFVKAAPKAKMIDDQYVIINATIALSEDYIATPEKESAIKTANGKMAKGDWKGAVDTLQLAGISVLQTQYLMPLNQTRKAVASAQKLLSTGKFYEANLVLKGAEEGIVIDSEMVGAGQ
ncbi:YfdX family protein [Citrobacter werkmanii]|uniref:YfdX family protein n=1 Tax=Citrobacter TaxID=544 RepID=UPI00050863BA|nr:MULTISPECIES: YfdX family protein [Citrobacter]MBJ5955830.1 YfdX family protein [Salmonella enterica subsp. enterica serovar Virchow]MBS6075383.1 YfdX family protein [Citrobacter freundii]MBU5601146.1 YfdX family protein [Citrobacter sp. S55_ASV_140]MBW9350656.1 YfdX family protein [Citrobacter sp. EC_71]MBY6246933.1 YfdX family protein [Citrobacter werkmanii]